MLVGLFSATLMFLPQAAADTGNLEGVVKFQGEIPESDVADDAGVRRRLIEVDPGTAGLRYVVAFLSSVKAESDARQNTTTKPAVVVDQLDYAFTPRVVAVQQGEQVTFTNSDPANHNVRTSSSVRSNQFNVFTGVNGKYQHRFVFEPQHRPVRLGCDIHPWMAGWIYVFEHPYFSITDQRGHFRIPNLPPGSYQLHLVQPDIKYREQRDIQIIANETCQVNTVVSATPGKQP